MEHPDRLKGRLRLLVSDSGGAPVAERRGSNIVVRRGAEIVASLLSGAAGSAPLNRVEVGFGRETANVEATALTPPPDTGIPPESLRATVPPEAFQIQTDRPGILQLFVTTRFQPSVELTDVSEAGLMANTVLYNQVVFEPVTLRVGQEVTFFWEVDLPYGH